MTLKEINDENLWENFLMEFKKRTFLQSWNWGEFGKEMGNKIFRKGLWDGNDLVAIFYAIKIKAKKGDFLLIPHGPLIKKFRREIIEELINEIKRMGRAEKVSFVRIAALWEEGSPENELIKQNGFIISPCLVYPEKSWQLSLLQSENEILSKMRKNTRYMIRKSEKEADLQVFKSQKMSDIDIFYEIYKETSLRNKFRPFSIEYIRKEFEIFTEKNQAVLFMAEKNGKHVAGAIVIFWQNVGFYHHGASVDGKNSGFASYLVQWEAIKEAQNRNCERYNFWAISPEENSKNHPWSGLTFFKKGFGGEEVRYSKTKDFPLTCRYWLTYFFEKIKL